MGGPLGKKDTFFFLSYQYDRSRTDLSNVFPVIATVPTTTGLTALRSASFHSGPGHHALFPVRRKSLRFGGQCFAATPPATPASAPDLEPMLYWHCSTVEVQFGSFDVPQGNLFDVYDHQASARIDRRLNDSNDFYGRYLVDDLNTPQAVLNPAGDVAFSDLGRLPDSRSILRQRTQSALLDERFARANSLNEVRFSYSRIAQGIGAYNLPSNLRSLPAATVADHFGGFRRVWKQFPFRRATVHSGPGHQRQRHPQQRLRSSGELFVDSQPPLHQDGCGFCPHAKQYHQTCLLIWVITSLGILASAAVSRALSLNPASEPTNAFAVLQALPDIITNTSGVITGQGHNELPLRETDEALFIQDDFHVRPNLNLSAGTSL